MTPPLFPSSQLISHNSDVQVLTAHVCLLAASLASKADGGGVSPVSSEVVHVSPSVSPCFRDALVFILAEVRTAVIKRDHASACSSSRGGDGWVLDSTCALLTAGPRPRGQFPPRGRCLCKPKPALSQFGKMYKLNKYICSQCQERYFQQTIWFQK